MAPETVPPLDPLHAYLARLRGHPRGAELWLDDSGRVHARVHEVDVTSVFDPISDMNGRIVGAQALARIVDDNAGAPQPAGDAATAPEPTPWALFEQAATPEERVALDRRCRTVHTLNFFADPASPHDLFLRVHDRLLTAVADLHGRAFKRVLDSLGVAQSRIVIELSPSACAHALLLANVIANYRLAGFRVAIEPVTLQELDTAMQVARVDFVRIDLARAAQFNPLDEVLTDAQRGERFRALPAPLLVNGVVDEDDRARARALGARFVQRGRG